MVDIFQPCVSFHKVNAFAWFKKRCRPLPADYDPTGAAAAMKTAYEWGERIPVGVIYKNDRPPLEEKSAALKGGPLASQPADRARPRKIIVNYT